MHCQQPDGTLTVSHRDTQLLLALGQYLLRLHAHEYREGKNYEVNGEEVEWLLTLAGNPGT